jgi:Flp pilus assembly protein TadB
MHCSGRVVLGGVAGPDLAAIEAFVTVALGVVPVIGTWIVYVVVVVVVVALVWWVVVSDWERQSRWHSEGDELLQLLAGKPRAPNAIDTPPISDMVSMRC